MRKLLYALGGLLVLLFIVTAGGAWYLRTALPDYDADARLPGLSAPVQVWRASLGVPQVWARTDADLYRAIGYLHAQDRLWQMELFRRVADGRLAEIFGERTLPSDRFLRTLGMGRQAGLEVAGLDPETRALLQAYADGVNAWIEGHPGALPPEFLALRIQPEPWTVRNSLSISKIMAWDLADWNIGLDLQRAIDRVGPDLARALYPAYPDWGPRILGADATWKGEERQDSGFGIQDSVAPLHATALRAIRYPLPRVPDLAAELLARGSISRASNSWVIGGGRTRSGKPILANDPHLSLSAPSLWYLAALHGDRTDAAGVTIPGIPPVIIGHTPGVAWGFTNVMLDDTDFFIEQVNPRDSTQYRTPDGWEPFTVRPETIQVKGKGPVVIRVRSTRHGRVISDQEERAGGRVLAMAWVSLRVPSTAPRAFLEMNRARTGEELVAALHDFNDPSQNVVWADTAGHFGYWLCGTVPVRRSGDGLLPVPGWTGEGDWVGFLDFDEHPHVLDPSEGFIVTANNRQIGAEYPFHIGSNFAPPYRALRIRQMVEASHDVTAAEVARQQMDVHDTHAERYLPLAVRAARAAGDTAAARMLEGWNAEASADSRAAAIFYVWYEELRHRVGDDEYGGKEVFFPRYAMDRVLDAGGGAWVDDVRTQRKETLGELSAEAMREAVREVAGRKWGEIHTTIMPHALGSVELMDRVLELNIGPFPNGGSPSTVDVAAYGSRLPFENSYGPSMRQVVDLADPNGAGGFIIPAGESGLPFSPHYRDQTPLWRSGRLRTLPLDSARAAAGASHRAVLRP